LSKHNWSLGACSILLLLATIAVTLPAQTTTVAPPAPTFKTLHSFDGTDGNSPVALVQATNGNFYGTTTYAGANNEGTVFKITPSGTLTTLYSFCVQTNCTDGSNPNAALVQGSNGNFYGTTYRGGANSVGTVFKITPSGTLTTLHSFNDNGSDGYFPYAALVQGSNGNFYGTTYNGGANYSCQNGCGTVFKITPSGTLTILHSFDGTDGSNPFLGGLVEGTDGNFYGTTSKGGGYSYCNGHNYSCGTVFKITPSGTLTTLHSFRGTDGDSPMGLVQATDGNFYGTTSEGGANNLCLLACGTVFQITPGGMLTTLYNFCSQSVCADGATPYAALVEGTDGNFYGTTLSGGANIRCGDPVGGCGTVFKITPSDTLTTLYSFCAQTNCADGSIPQAELVQDTNGKFYGTTPNGGASGNGTAFSLSVGLGPFVVTEPTSGAVGAAVKILGTNLTGSTAVTFNGTAAAFTVKTKSEITTNVPTGATTGRVQVVAPGGTLSSNVPFTVTP
jgi:uncharacterized repeat protein (TIGR03803 family)